MLVARLRLRDFRGYAAAEVRLGPGLTVVHGRNGAGKTNLLEALYFGCTGRSCRTSNEREVVRFGAQAARVEVPTRDPDGRDHELAVGLPARASRSACGSTARTVERLSDASARPLVSVFLPDRLELVKGPPALRRRHLDQVVAAIWPARARSRAARTRRRSPSATRSSRRIRAGRASRSSLPAWDAELARHGIALRDDRAATVELLAAPFTAAAAELGLTGEATLRYRPRSTAPDAETLAAELAERVDSDLERGFTGHGPHRDDLVLARDGRELRAYGSQGEQRMGLLALLLAERDVLADERGAPPLLLLDDVMSELDSGRRGLLAERLGARGQALVTTTDLGHVPGADTPDVTRLRVVDGTVARRGDEGVARGMRHRRAPRPLAGAVGALAETPAAGHRAGVGAGGLGGRGRPRDRPRGTPRRGAGGHRHGGLHVVRLGTGDRPHGPRAVRSAERPSRPRAGDRAPRAPRAGATVDRDGSRDLCAICSTFGTL